MHEEVLHFRAIKKLVVDHKNGDTLDNRKANLRICTDQENHWNSRPKRNNVSSKYKCVGYTGSYVKDGRRRPLSKPWTVNIIRAKKRIFSMSFADENDAYLVSQEKLKEYHGEFAYLVPWDGYSNPDYPNRPINYRSEGMGVKNTGR